MEKKTTITPQQKAAIEYNRRLQKGEYVKPEKLDGKTVMDILGMPEFKNNMGAYINEQKMTRAAVLEQRRAIRKAGKIPAPEKRPCVDRVIELGLLENVDDFTNEFVDVIQRSSRHPAEIREYIRQLGMLAYRMTVEQFICEVNPDMAELVKEANKTTNN